MARNVKARGRPAIDHAKAARALKKANVELGGDIINLQASMVKQDDELQTLRNELNRSEIDCSHLKASIAHADDARFRLARENAKLVETVETLSRFISDQRFNTSVPKRDTYSDTAAGLPMTGASQNVRHTYVPRTQMPETRWRTGRVEVAAGDGTNKLLKI